MTPRKRLLTIAFTLALGLGVWTLAFTFQSASYTDGDVLSAADLNQLLNDNFQAASDAVDARVERSGDTMSGRLDIVGDAVDVDGTSTLFRVSNESTSGGSAALFSTDSDAADEGAVSVVQQGSGPALSLKSASGRLIVGGISPTTPSFVVETDGSIKIGASGADTSPALHLDAAAGTVTNDVGSGLPLGYGSVDAAGTIRGGTSNWTVEYSDAVSPTYYVDFDGVGYNISDFAAIVTPEGGSPVTVVTNWVGSGSEAELAIEFFDPAGDPVANNFHFAVFGPGS